MEVSLQSLSTIYLFQNIFTITGYCKSLFLSFYRFIKTRLKDKKQKRRLHTSSRLKKEIKGSITVEAAVSLPVFLCFLVCILMFFKILVIQWGVETSMYESVRDVSIIRDESQIQPTLAIVGATDFRISNKHTPIRFIQGNLLGLVYDLDSSSPNDIDISVSYSVDVPGVLVGKHGLWIGHRCKARRWSGYDPLEDSDGNESVYVTTHGIAYHRSLFCVYLNPSIKSIDRESLVSARNESGAIYKKCKRCSANGGSVIYITDYGNAYHSSVGCSGLKRSIRSVSIKEAIKNGYHACKKCG